jgi:transcriptional regulator with XRE-family HTH domain
MSTANSNPKYKKFQQLLVACRQERGITQNQLAERLGRPQSFVSKYENGERRIDLVEFLEIANALAVNPTEFIARLQEGHEHL